MMNPGELHVWHIELDTLPDDWLPPPHPADAERAARFAHPDLRRRYLRSHGVMREILRREVGVETRIAPGQNGKPWLPAAPSWKFNLSHSRGTALVAVARDVEVGVDVEWIRPQRDAQSIAERFFPPSEAEAFLATPEPERARDFFRRWTRLEAMWKALGVGLHGAGREIEGSWTVEELHLGEALAAAVAAPEAGLRVVLRGGALEPRPEGAARRSGT